MGDGVDNGFGNGFFGKFVFDGDLRPLGAGANGAGNFGEDKAYGLVHEVKDGAFVNLVGGDGFSNVYGNRTQGG